MTNDNEIIKEIEKVIGKQLPILEGYYPAFGVFYRDNVVTYLSLQDENLIELPEMIMELKNLEKLDLRSNNLTFLPDSIGDLKDLKILILTGNNLENLPDSIGNLEKLESLEVSSNNLSSIPDTIGELKSLEILRLNENALISLPSTLGNLISINELEIRNNKLSNLPESLGVLKNIQKLDLRQNIIENLPNTIGGLKELKRFELDGNNLVHLPENIKYLDNLEFLHVNKNQIVNIQDSLGELRNLKYLNLNYNKLALIPDLSSSNTVKRINLIGNPLNLDDINRERYSKLRKIGANIECEPLKLMFFQGVKASEIKVIESFLSKNESLKLIIVWGDTWSTQDKSGFIKVQYKDGHIIELRCERSYLNELPDNLGDLIMLQKLNLSGNSIDLLPNSIETLIKLEILDLSDNKLSSLPESIANLIDLKQLNLSKNQFVEIPTILWPLNKLALLLFQDNPLNAEDLSVSKKIPELILKYLRKKAAITVFISHAVQDFEPYRLKELAEYLRDQKEISEVYVCEENLTGNIDQWMLETVPKSHLLLFIATNKSVFNSPDCLNELELAKKFSIPSVPIKGMDVDWPDLVNLGVARELGKDYNLKNFKEFCKDVYEYIYSFKREMDLMSEKKRYKGFYNIYERFQITIKDLEERMKATEERLLKRIETLENQINK